VRYRTALKGGHGDVAPGEVTSGTEAGAVSGSGPPLQSPERPQIRPRSPCL